MRVNASNLEAAVSALLCDLQSVDPRCARHDLFGPSFTGILAQDGVCGSKLCR